MDKMSNRELIDVVICCWGAINDALEKLRKEIS